MRKSRLPSYRLHKPSGQAVVTLSGRDFYLGPHGTQVSKDEYNRVVAEWLASGRQLPPDANPSRPAITVGELILRYWEHLQGYYGDGSDKLTPELYHQRRVLRVVRRLYSRVPVSDFGPIVLKACREEFVKQGYVRRSVNRNIQRLRRMFRWGVKNELIEASVFQALQAVEGLRRGRTDAKEGKKVRPVPAADIEAVQKTVPTMVSAMIEVQRRTGSFAGRAQSSCGTSSAERAT